VELQKLILLPYQAATKEDVLRQILAGFVTDSQAGKIFEELQKDSSFLPEKRPMKTLCGQDHDYPPDRSVGPKNTVLNSMRSICPAADWPCPPDDRFTRQKSWCIAAYAKLRGTKDAK